MRNLVFGTIGVLWGGAILIYAIVKGINPSDGAYAAGQTTGFLFGVVMFGAGLFALIPALRKMIRGDDDSHSDQ